MSDIKVRNFDDSVATALRSRPKAKGISLEEEVRRTIAASLEADRADLVNGQERCTRQRAASPSGRRWTALGSSARSLTPGRRAGS